MGIISDYLKELISNQVEDRNMVVWFDPDNEYTEFIKNFTLADTKIVFYEDSFFRLRHSIDSCLNNIEEDVPPRLLVYVPMDEEKTSNALAELTKPGVVMKPRQQPPQLNTRLSVVAKGALKGILPDDEIEELQKKIDEKILTLEELDKYADKIRGRTPGLIDLVFETKDPLKVTLMFLNNQSIDKTILEKNALDDMVAILEMEYGLDFSSKKTCMEIRETLAQKVLLVEFVNSLIGDIPTQLSTIELPDNKPHINSCVNLVQTWRSNRDYIEEYVQYANLIEKQLSIADIEYTLPQIQECETFQCIEENLQLMVETEMVRQSTEELLNLAEKRQNQFWSYAIGEIKSRWTLIYIAGSLLIESDRIENSLTNNYTSATEIVDAYTQGDHPWSLLDTYHRRMENRYLLFESTTKREKESLSKLMSKCRKRYLELCNKISQTFIDTLKSFDSITEGIVKQNEIFNNYVSPAIRLGKTAYFLIDALRFEMAKELAISLKEGYDVEVQATLGMVPAITPVGMAALLPGADKSYTLETQKQKGILPTINQTVINDRETRMKWFKQKTGEIIGQNDLVVKCFKLEDVINMSPKIEDQIKEADFIVVTSQEIDQICETGNIIAARSIMDNILKYIVRGIRNLVHIGCNSIVLTADHGFLFGEEISDDMKIPSPQGKIIEIHRRVWIGNGGNDDPAFIRFSKLPFDLNDELEIAFPYGIGIFKTPGTMGAYFHGGISPQEIIIPVLTILPKNIEVFSQSVIWEFLTLKKVITTRTLTVKINGKSQGLEFTPPKVRVEIKENEKVISETFGASYGFDEETKEIQLESQELNNLELKTNDVNLVLVDEPKGKKVDVYLIDAATGSMIQSIRDIKIKLSF